MGFDAQPELEGATLRLRPLRAEDREALAMAASDPATWAGHPVKNRHERAVFDPYFDILLASQGTLVVIDKAKDMVIGCSRYYQPPTRPGTIAIGYTFLMPAYWGGVTNFEMKTLMLDHALEQYDEVWLDIGPDNIRSQKATLKLGARKVFEGRLDLGTGREDDYFSYTLSRADWEATKAAKG
ncbi:GNAT family N-acetyltransferase [Roseovarius sp. 2305UL8-3]|uniref:GNAT family N-acetyltransferase n=1 Tax=Roseovarius conchicola TaxID=3121636 RepID=UPI003527AB7B